MLLDVMKSRGARKLKVKGRKANRIQRYYRVLMMTQTLDENCYSWLLLVSYLLDRRAEQFFTSVAR